VFELSLESNESVGVVCFDVEFECFEFGCCGLAECVSDCTSSEGGEEVSDSASGSVMLADSSSIHLRRHHLRRYR
jgi:hypothetical protein